jgi:hypothetical protein
MDSSSNKFKILKLIGEGYHYFYFNDEFIALTDSKYIDPELFEQDIKDKPNRFFIIHLIDLQKIEYPNSESAGATDEITFYYLNLKGKVELIYVNFDGEQNIRDAIVDEICDLKEFSCELKNISLFKRLKIFVISLLVNFTIGGFAFVTIRYILEIENNTFMYLAQYDWFDNILYNYLSPILEFIGSTVFTILFSILLIFSLYKTIRNLFSTAKISICK